MDTYPQKKMLFSLVLFSLMCLSTYMCGKGQRRVWNALELELWTVVSHPRQCWEANLGPWQE